jgi:hypothetical protein
MGHHRQSSKVARVIWNDGKVCDSLDIDVSFLVGSECL